MSGIGFAGAAPGVDGVSNDFCCDPFGDSGICGDAEFCGCCPAGGAGTGPGNDGAMSAALLPGAGGANVGVPSGAALPGGGTIGDSGMPYVGLGAPVVGAGATNGADG